MSIVESSSEAQTLMEPVMKPVANLSVIKNAAARIESRATADFAASSVFSLEALLIAEVAISLFTVDILHSAFARSMAQGFGMLCDFFEGVAAAGAPDDDCDA